jgi:hypothetical protein
MILSELRTTATAFAEATGWTPKPEGLCKGEICVPAPGSLAPDGTVDVSVAAQRLGMPVVHDAQHGLYAVGAATLAGHALASAEAADPELIDRNGKPFRLSSLRGRKVVLVAWSTY